MKGLHTKEQWLLMYEVWDSDGNFIEAFEFQNEAEEFIEEQEDE